MLLISEVPGFEGQCKPTWLNRNSVYIRLDGGITGFFRLVRTKSFLGIDIKVRYGDEFHGIIRDGKVFSTEGKY